MPFTITHVKNGAAPDSVDCVFIDLDRCGFYSWKGVVYVGGRAIYGGSPPDYRTVHEAQVAAVSWAMGYGSMSLFIEGDGH